MLLALVVGATPVLASRAHSAGRTTPAPVEAKVLREIEASGKATFWVVFREEADLHPASAISNRGRRGRFVFDRLNDVALRSQARIRAFLAARGVGYRPFWIVNAVRVTAGSDVLRSLAAMPEVKEIVSPRTYPLPDPSPAPGPGPTIESVEWGINAINAPQVWASFNDRGENIVVANIDTGVQYNHPALVQQYRGNLGGGNFDHNYNWFDPSEVCGSPSLVPCDNNGHGTHTMGTMVGRRR
jgi:subtilisin family serine protease